MADRDRQVRVGAVLDGRYRLDEVIGSGAMGTVFRATQLTVQRSVAVKILNASVKHHPKLQQRFEVEARAVASLNHPGVLTLFDFAYSMDKDVLYMVAEFIDGETLTRVLSRGALPIRDALRYAYEIADALAEAHDRGVVHRDLKPGNVMLARTRRGTRVKVLDFGLARVQDDGEQKRITNAGDVHGAPGYISPEQCVGDTSASTPSDLYSLGCIMFEMLEGRLPFDYDSPGKLMQAHLYEDPPTPKNGDVPVIVRDLVHRMLAKKPDERPTADDVVALLAPLLECVDKVDQADPDEQISRNVPAPRPPQALVAVILVLLTLLVLAIVIR